MNSLLQPSLVHDIQKQLGNQFTLDSIRPVAGGDINQSLCVQSHGKRYFLKINQPQLAEMFAAEFYSLSQLQACGTLTIPQPLCHGSTGHQSYLLMQYLEFSGCRDGGAALGEGLARLHQISGDTHGWPMTNYIGSSTQPNQPCESWLMFWNSQRLQHQADLAAQKPDSAVVVTAIRQVMEFCNRNMSDHQPPASLLHGDLWGGNAACTSAGKPAIFDPACYYGDRETDLAMSELFGGFSAQFYAAYNAVWPLDSGYGARKKIYQFYHICNHYNLFGGGYGRQAVTLAKHICR